MCAATHAALAWDTARHQRRFRSALASRDLTGQAKGILIARFNIDPIRSFELLKRVSQESNTGLVHIPRELTIRNRFDDLGDAFARTAPVFYLALTTSV